MESVSTLKYFLTDEDLSVPHVCGACPGWLERQYDTCPACEAMEARWAEEDRHVESCV